MAFVQLYDSLSEKKYGFDLAETPSAKPLGSENDLRFVFPGAAAVSEGCCWLCIWLGLINATNEMRKTTKQVVTAKPFKGRRRWGAATVGDWSGKGV